MVIIVRKLKKKDRAKTKYVLYIIANLLVNISKLYEIFNIFNDRLYKLV